MSKGLIFFCCACCILLLTIINLSIGPIISGRAENLTEESWGTLNCASLKDDYDETKKRGIKGDELKYKAGWALNECKRKKGMHDMEYTAFIFDIVIGFVCGLLGLLHFFEVKKDLVPKTGIIGLGCGIVGFVLTFVYVIFNGLVFTTVDSPLYKRDKNYAFAEKDGNSFKCLYFDKEHNSHSLMAKVSDLNKKQYNYNKDWEKNIDAGCIVPDPSICSSQKNIPLGIHPNCQKLYVADGDLNFLCKDISDRFYTTLILGLVVCLANIGLALFGFLLFRTPGEF